MSTRPQLRRRGALLAAGLLAAVLCAGCGEVHFPARPAARRPLTVALDGPPSALYAALYAAQAGGDFRAGTLAVTIDADAAGGALAALRSHRADVAISSEAQLLAARSTGTPLVAIAALVRQPLDGIVSLASRPLASVSALAGRTIAVAPGAFAHAELATALAHAHVAVSSVREVALGPNPEAMLRRHAAVATLGVPWPSEVAALAIAHQSANVLEIQQAGVPSYSSLVVVVRVGEAHYDGPLLRAFLQSLTRGERAATSDPAAAAKTLARVNPGFSAAFERALLGQLLPISAPADTSKPFGYQNPYAWQAFGAWMSAHGLGGQGPSGAGLAITDEFLPGQGEAIITGD